MLIYASNLIKYVASGELESVLESCALLCSLASICLPTLTASKVVIVPPGFNCCSVSYTWDIMVYMYMILYVCMHVCTYICMYHICVYIFACMRFCMRLMMLYLFGVIFDLLNFYFIHIYSMSEHPSFRCGYAYLVTYFSQIKPSSCLVVE